MSLGRRRREEERREERGDDACYQLTFSVSWDYCIILLFDRNFEIPL